MADRKIIIKKLHKIPQICKKVYKKFKKKYK